MAASLLLLLLVSACTAELGFKPKRQYTYLYEAKQASGIPGLQSQWSALGMKMKIKIQVPTSSNLYFKLENMQQGELKNVKTHQQWRDNFRMPYSPIQQNQQDLGKVFKVELNGGVVRKITTTQGEPVWVVNIKKSITQMFQLDLQRHQATDMPSMAQPSGYQSGDQADFFRVMEDSIGGECETLYETTTHLPDNIKADMVQELTILSQSSLPGIKVPKADQFQPFVVTKTKNYQNCKTRPNWQHMTPGAVSCRSDDCYLTASNRSASSRYVLDGDRSSFQIQSVVAESEALMFPYGFETEQLWTVTNQTLFLQQESAMGSFFGEPKPPKSYEKLTFQYPTADDKDLKMPDLISAPQLSTHLPGVPVKLIQSHLSPDQLVNLVKSIIQKVDQLLNKVPDPVQQDVAGYVVEIERAFSWLSYDKLEQVYRGLTSQGQQDIFWDTLALTGTNPAVMKILDGIKQDKIAKTQMCSIVATLPINIKTPTYELINKLFTLFKSNTIQSKKPQRMTMALSLGNIFYQVCISNTTVEHSYTQGLYPQHFCSSQFKTLLKEEFIPFLEEKIKDTEEPEKLVYIQALGNVGDQQIIKVLSKLIADQRSSPLVVTKAIYAFYRVVAQYPEKVRNVASPIFHDVSRPTDVRLAAVSMLLTSNPPIAYWQKIATSTWFEPSNTVVALIHSTYSTMANITMAHVQPLFEMSRRARITLPLVRPPQGGFAFSGSYNYRNGQIIPQYQVAALTQLSVVASKTSLIPSAIYMDFQHYINSILYSNHRWTLDVQGGQHIIDEFMGVGSTSPGRRQSARDLSAGSQQLNSIMRSLNLTQQEPEKFQATLYTQLMGAMDAFFAYDKNSYTEMVQKIRQGYSWSRNQTQKIAYLEDTTVTFPSEIGMPVIYSKKMPIVASARGEMNVTWNMNEGTYSVTMQKVQWIVAVKSLVMVSTVSPFSLRTLGAGVENKVQLSLPMSLKAKFDIQAKKLQVEMEMVQQPSPAKVAHIQTLPFTTAAEVNKYENLVTSSDTKEITTSHQADIRVPFGKDFGINGHMRLVSDSPIMNFGTFWTEFKKRGTTGITHFWAMMASLRSRHYDIVIDTASSPFQKFQATFASVSSDKQMRQPIITNQQHNSQITTNIKEAKQLMQGKQWEMSQTSQQQRLPMSSQAGYVAVGTITQKTGPMLHYRSQVALVSDAQWYTQKLSFRAVLPSNKVCLDTVMAFPTLSDIREKLLSANVTAPVWAKLSYGSNCGQHSLTMNGTVSRDQLATEYAERCPEALRCSQHEKRGNPNSADCRIAKNHAALANNYEFNFIQDNLTPQFRNASYSLDFFVKYVLWPYMSNDPYAQNPSNKVSIKIQLNPNNNGMSLRISKPFETTTYEDVQLPFNTLYEPGLLTMRKSISKKISDSLHGVDKTVCLVDQLMVKTFDNVTLERKPSSDSWTMLTWDSSCTRNLAIFEKVVNQKPVVRILVDDKVIEIDSSSLQHVKVGGTAKSLTPATPVIVRGTAGERDTTSDKIIAQVLMLTDDTVKVVLPEHYAKLLVTKEGVQIHTTMLAYRNRLRGLCGDFNGEQQDDLVDLNGCIYKKGQEFHDAYRFPVERPSQFQPRRPDHCIRRPAQANQSQGVYSTFRRH